MTTVDSTRAIVARAPGKLFVAGEYAVVSPGEPSVLIAVDRYLTVSLSESVDAGSIHSPEYSRMPVRWTRGQDGLTLDREHHPYDYVIAAIEVSERLRAERGLRPRFFDLFIESGLDDPSGRKFGLGSSAAVTVATIAAIDRFYGFDLGTRGRYELAMLATIAVAPMLPVVTSPRAPTAVGSVIAPPTATACARRARRMTSPVSWVRTRGEERRSHVSRLPRDSTCSSAGRGTPRRRSAWSAVSRAAPTSRTARIRASWMPLAPAWRICGARSRLRRPERHRPALPPTTRSRSTRSGATVACCRRSEHGRV